MKYISTRGKAAKLDFEDVVIAGLASDGGLYVPEEFVSFSKEQIANMSGKSYEDVAFEVMWPYINEALPQDEFKDIIKNTYQEFRHKDIAPLTKIRENEYILELYHGPTLAFKDFALQLLGRLLSYILKKNDKKVTVVGATSGDTGSAAIDGLKACKNIDIFIMHPHNRISEVQRKQMTTILSDNVHNIALNGYFDDCQNIVKQLFSDPSFLQGKSSLVAVNSINWARILAQVVYYFYAAVKLGAPDKEVSFCVPTGNFGDIYAGYIAKKMGLPIKQLIIATNSNDILHRFMQNNEYKKEGIKATLSPSMDIQISSNFERLLFDLYDNDGDIIRNLMEDFKTGPISVDEKVYNKVKEIFNSNAASDEDTIKTIAQVYQETKLSIDPHTATGIFAARKCNASKETPMIILSTAHPAKFADSVIKAGLPNPELPEHLKDLFEKEERMSVLENDIDIIKDYIVKANL